MRIKNKTVLSLVLAITLMLSLSSFSIPARAESLSGNYTDEMKFDDGVDLNEEDGSDSVEREGDHVDSPYFNHLDFYNMDSTDTLTILPHFKTIQQSSERIMRSRSIWCRYGIRQPCLLMKPRHTPILVLVR